MKPSSGRSALKVRGWLRAKVHWAKMDAKKLMTDGPPKGKEHRRPELYFDGVMEGSHLVAKQCAKDVIFP